MKALLCPMTQGGYLYPAIAIGRELAAGGDEVSLLGPPSIAAHASAAGLEHVGADQLDGRYGFNIARWHLDSAALMANIVRVAREVRPDILVASVLGLGALLAGELLDLPVMVIGFATHVSDYRSPGREDPDLLADRRWRTGSMLTHYRTARERHGLAPRSDRPGVMPFYGAGLLLRGCPSLLSPGAQLPPQVHQVGPCQWEPDTPPEELAELCAAVGRNGKPLVYVHLGRTFGAVDMWSTLNPLFTDTGFQAVVEVGRSGMPQPSPKADITVVNKPWMRRLVDLSDLVMTSGTTSPVTAALQAERPLLMAPAGSEQPALTDVCVQAGVAHRYCQAGPDADQPVQAAIDSPALREGLSVVSAELRRMPGPSGAAQLIRSCVSGRPYVVSTG